jgi:hypothetical protein
VTFPALELYWVANHIPCQIHDRWKIGVLEEPDDGGPDVQGQQSLHFDLSKICKEWEQAGFCGSLST